MSGEDVHGNDLRSAMGHNPGGTFNNSFNNSIRNNTTSIRDINTSGGRAMIANQFNGDVTINETSETEEQRRDHKRQELIESLAFAENESRYESVAPAYPETFRWVFDDLEAGRGAHSFRWKHFDSLVDWLERDGSSIYWIQGKAGSGKSTLLKFIGEHSATRAHLKVWAQGKPVVLPHHFFWRAGSEKQKNTVGLLRTLLHQILTDFPSLINNLPGFHDKRVQTWTYERLASALTKVVDCDEYCFCLLIDGIDEFDSNSGSVDDLVELLERLSHLQNVKVCLSSRPELFLKDSFGRYEGLRLQDLTADDIERTVRGKLMATERFSKYDRQDPKWSTAFIKTICEKADGIFLWVHLAMADILNGLRKHDTMQLLQERLKHLSKSLHGLFASFLQRLEPVYKESAANLVRIRLLQYQDGSDRVPSVLDYAAAFDALELTLGDSDYGLRSIADDDISALSERLGELTISIPEHSAGLLEFSPLPKIHLDSDPELWLYDMKDKREGIHAVNKLSDITYYFSRGRIDFIHRSVSDFFLDNEDAKSFVATTANSEIGTLNHKRRCLQYLTWISFAVFAHTVALAADHGLPSILARSWASKLGSEIEHFNENLVRYLSTLVRACRPKWSPDNKTAVWSHIQTLLRLMETNYPTATFPSYHKKPMEFMCIWHKLSNDNEALALPGPVRSMFISAIGSSLRNSVYYSHTLNILADLVGGQMGAGIALKDCLLHASEHVNTKHVNRQDDQPHKQWLRSRSEWRFLEKLFWVVSDMPPADEESAVRQIITYIEDDAFVDDEIPVAPTETRAESFLDIYLTPLAYVKRLWAVKPRYLDMAVSALERRGVPELFEAAEPARGDGTVQKLSSPIHQEFAKRALEYIRVQRSQDPPTAAFPEGLALDEFLTNHSAELGITDLTQRKPRRYWQGYGF